jgi:hypothetical protein
MLYISAESGPIYVSPGVAGDSVEPLIFWHRVLYYFWRLSAPYMLAPLNPALITFYNLSTIVSNNSWCGHIPVDYVLLWKEEMPGSKVWNDSQLYSYVHCLSSSNLSKYKRVNKVSFVILKVKIILYDT